MQTMQDAGLPERENTTPIAGDEITDMTALDYGPDCVAGVVVIQAKPVWLCRTYLIRF